MKQRAIMEGETMDRAPFTPDCGHLVTPEPGDIGTGKATDPGTGRTLCYPCAEEREREIIRTGSTTRVYVDEAKRVITAWTRAELGKITSLTRGVRRYGRDGAYRMRTIRVRTPDDRDWYGYGSDNNDAVTIRRRKR